MLAGIAFLGTFWLWGHDLALVALEVLGVLPLLVLLLLVWGGMGAFITRRALRTGLLGGLLAGAACNPAFRDFACGGLLGIFWILLALFMADNAWRRVVAWRRRLLERLGLRGLRRWVRPQVIHQDRESRLLRWAFLGDEPIVVVEVVCPSTGQDYLLRVPPEVRTCRQAVAWTFGLSADSYAPAQET